MNESFLIRRYESVKAFNKAFGHLVNEELQSPKDHVDYLTNRQKFIKEEIEELQEAISKQSREGILDALIDIDYFVLGTLVGLGSKPKVDWEIDWFLKKWGCDSVNVNNVGDINERLISSPYFSCMKFILFTQSALRLFGFTEEQYQTGFDLVHEANMDKMCSSVEELEETKKHYLDSGVETISEKFEYEGKTKFIVYRVDTGKVLKRKGWKPCDLKSVL